jgi:hypothetical protein
MAHPTDIYTASKPKNKSMNIEQKTRFQTNLSNMCDLDQTTVGKTLGIETLDLIDRDEPEAWIIDLMDEAENACMAYYELRIPIPWSCRLNYNGKDVVNRSA